MILQEYDPSRFMIQSIDHRASLKYILMSPHETPGKTYENEISIGLSNDNSEQLLYGLETGRKMT